MRVLAVTNMYPTPGMPASGIFVAEQVKGMRAIGLEVEVEFVDRQRRGMLAYYSMLGPIRRTLRRFAPDVLHIMYGGVMAERITRKINHVPRVVTFHGSDLLGENLSGLLRKLISHYGVSCSRRAAGRADGVILVSNRLKQALPKGLDSRRIQVIPCGIDLQRFRPLNKADCQRELGWDAKSFHILFPSHRNNAVKRPALALAAVGDLQIGGISAILHFLEGVPNSQVPVWMNASDALVLTSAHEGSPTAVKEALACGLPVVSVDVGDVAERLDGIEGCYLAAGDSVDVAAKLRLVFHGNRRVLARSFIEQLSLENIARKMAAYYQELLEGHKLRASGPVMERVPCAQHAAPRAF